jgi:dTDP-6-deoxy-L-talose 4-dehydrogenase (NAD+)
VSAPSVVVTGAAGFVGRRLAALLEQRGDPVVAVAHRWADRHELAALLGEGPVAWCAHLGWYARPGDYLTNGPANLDALARSLELVEALGDRGCPHLVVTGSSAEYGGIEGPLHEDGPIDPPSVYGAAKASLRLLLRSGLRSPGMVLCWARLFNIAGPGEHPDRFVPSVARGLLAGERVAVSVGTQRRDFLDVDDVARALLHLGDAGVAGDVNVCSGEGISLRTFLSAIADRLGRRELLDFGARPASAHELRDVVGVNDRLVKATGWSAQFDRDGIAERVVDYWRSVL